MNPCKIPSSALFRISQILPIISVTVFQRIDFSLFLHLILIVNQGQGLDFCYVIEVIKELLLFLILTLNFLGQIGAHLIDLCRFSCLIIHFHTFAQLRIMDFESQNSTPKSTGDNDPVLSVNTLIDDDVKIGCNGSCAHDDEHDLNTNGNGCREPSPDPEKPKEEADKLNFNDHENVELRSGYGSLHSNRSTSGDYVDAVTMVNSVGKGTEKDQDVMDSPVSPAEVPLGSPGMSPPTSGTKGKGLRKWRRIRREFLTEGTLNKDSAKILKRGSENVLNPSEVAAEMKLKGEASESSINTILDNPIGADAFPLVGSSSVYELGSSSTFSPGAVSDEERTNSKSSTVASVPKSRHDLPRASGHSRDKHRTKHMSGKHSGNTSQRSLQVKDQVDASKKARGEALNVDKENSLSSMESDLRNYSSVFMQGSSSAINNGQSDSYAVEQSDDRTAVEQSVEGLPTEPSKSVDDEDTLQGEAEISWKIRGRDKNHQLPGNWDPLVDCVEMLQSAHDALEQEIQKFGELGKDVRPLDDELIRTCGLAPEVSGSSSSEWPTFEDFGREVPDALEKQLAQAKAMLKEKESMITELEATINNLRKSNEDLGRSVDVQQKKCEDIEAEVEILFKQKMETEIQYLAIVETSTIAENQMKLLLIKPKSLVSAQAQEMQQRGHFEGEVKEMITSRRGTARPEIGKMQKRVAKFTFCFFLQLILFIFVLVFFMSQFLPKTEVVLPT